VANAPDKWDNEGDNLISGAMPMYRTTSDRKDRIAVWIVWLLVMVSMLLLPSMVPEYGVEAVVSGTSVVLADMPSQELFPWWPRVRWRKYALATYRRWKRARGRARRRAQLGRLALAGAISFATLVDWLTKRQLRRQLGALPVLYAVLEVLQVRSIINRYAPNRREVDNGTVTQVLVLNRLIAPRALWRIADWAAKTVLVYKLGVPASKFNDDRLARTLDDLAPHCRAIWIEVVSVAIQRYDINLDMIFYDLSAFVTHGDYAESDYVNFGFAHNTPSDKRKFKAGLNVASDGNIPVDYCLWAGNAADKATVQSNLERLCQLLRKHGYQTNQVLLIGDRATLDDKLAFVYQDKEIRYLAGLEPQKKVHRELVRNVSESEFYQHPLTDERGKDGYWGVSVDVPLEYAGEKFTHRGLVVLSGPMRSAHAKSRAKHFRALWPELLTVQHKALQNKPHYRSAEAVLARAQTKLRNSPVGQFVQVWTTGQQGHIQLHWRVKRNELVAAMHQDGRYLLVTNDPCLTPQQMLTLYRQKDGVEKCFTVCKQDLKVSPIYLHKDSRIEAMLLINMLALLTYSILERQMRQQGLQLTTRRLIEHLETLCIIETHCWDGSVLMRPSPLTPEQMQLLGLIDVIVSTPLSRIVDWAPIAGPPSIPLLLPPSS
jgi:transposase